MRDTSYRKIVIAVIIIILLLIGFLLFLKFHKNGSGSQTNSSTAPSGTDQNGFPLSNSGSTSGSSSFSNRSSQGYQGSNSSFNTSGNTGNSGTGNSGSGVGNGLANSSGVTAPPSNPPPSSSAFANPSSPYGQGASAYQNDYPVTPPANSPPSGVSSGSDSSGGNNLSGGTPGLPTVPSGGYQYSTTTFTYTDVNGSSSTSTLPTYQNGAQNCGINCIQGFKVPLGSIAETQTVTLDQQQSTTDNSYAFTNLAPGLHGISVSVPSGWYVGYTLCINSTTCHDDVPVKSDGLVLDFLTTANANSPETGTIINVPPNSYVDLYWHYSLTPDVFADVPVQPYQNTGTLPTSYTGGTGNPNNPLENAAKSAAACLIGAEVSGFVRSAVSTGLGAINKLTSTITSTLLVPTDDKGFNSSTQTSNSSGLTGARAGVFIYGIQVLPSWDSIQYCLVNALIVFINQQTLQWINTAFNGNPAFVQSLGPLLAGIGDQAALNFFAQTRGLNPTSPFGGAVNQAVISGYSTPFASQSAYNLNTGLPNGADRTFLGPNGFSLATPSVPAPNSAGAASNAYGPISSLQGNWGNWYNLTQNGANNPYGQYLIYQAALVDNVGNAQANTAQTAAYGNGYLPVTKPPVAYNPCQSVSSYININPCTPNNGTNSAGTPLVYGNGTAGAALTGTNNQLGTNLGLTSGGSPTVLRAQPVGGSPNGTLNGLPTYKGQPAYDPNSYITTVPGINLQQTGQQVINLPYQRLVNVTSFDQAINALVNSIVYLSLNKIFGN